MRRRLSWVSLVVLVVLLAATAAATWTAHRAVHDQEGKLLNERANEVRLVLTTAINSLSDELSTLGGILQTTHNSEAAFDHASSAMVSSDKRISVAVLRRTASGYRILMANGTGLQRGQVIADQRTVALDRAMTTDKIVPTPVLGSGNDRAVGFALGPPATPRGMVVYRQTNLGRLGPPRTAHTAPFSEVRVVLYDGTSPRLATALVSTSRTLPLTGQVVSKPLTVGSQHWLLQVRAVHPLVGSTTANSPWFVLAAGLLVCALVTATAEVEARRRASALALYRNEHRLAEGLQRSLLPELPAVAGLDIAARYLPGTEGLQVGGDWYDIFTLDHGRIGVVIGDVVGHDISATATMSRVQAALRAYAFRIENPAVVLDRLDMLIDTFQTDRLITLFYGVLGAPDVAGGREFWYSNAGHPPPLACRSGSEVEELDGGASVLLGVAPAPEGSRPSDRTRLAAGSTLMLFTDGLIEVPGESMTDSLARLKAAAAQCGEIPPEELCDRLTADLPAGVLRDDVAVVAIRLGSVPPRQAVAGDTPDGAMRSSAPGAGLTPPLGPQPTAPDQSG
jgi:hypothetical protein